MRSVFPPVERLVVDPIDGYDLYGFIHPKFDLLVCYILVARKKSDLQKCQHDVVASRDVNMSQYESSIYVGSNRHLVMDLMLPSGTYITLKIPGEEASSK